LEEIMSHMAEAQDTIILDGKVFDLNTRPLEGYLQRIDWRPKFIRPGPGNLRGYMARWEVFEERLFLTGLFGMNWIFPSHLRGKLAPDPDPDPFVPARHGVKSLRLPDLFPDQAPLVFADWVTERLVVPIGPLLFFGDSSFGSFHAIHRTIEVVEGRVRSFRDWKAFEWARKTGCNWLIDEFRKNDPQVVVPTEPSSDTDEDDAEDDSVAWRNADDPLPRQFRCRRGQEVELCKPCGRTPNRPK
jgi:hypothetical protein